MVNAEKWGAKRKKRG